MENLISNKEDAIDFYLDCGFVLFPLNGKVPPKDCHWREITYSPFVEFQHNFGIQLKNTDLVIDVDPRNFKNGISSLALLEHALEKPLKPTLTVLTGAGGTHLYFKKPAEFKIRKSLKEFPGIDFLSDGCYVVGAGSLHPTTNQIYILNQAPIIQADNDLLNLIQKQETTLKIEGHLVYIDDEQTKQRYIDYLSKSDGAIQGAGGDGITFTVAATGRDFGLSSDICYQLMADHYNAKCEPPWNLEELRNKVNNAYKYSAGEIGSKAPTIAFPKTKFEVWSPEQDRYFHRNDNGKIKIDQHNVALMFSPEFPLNGLLAIDLFSHNIVFTKKAPWHTNKDVGIKLWGDDEAIRARHWLSTNYKFEPSQVLMHEGALAAAYQFQFHPVKDYFEGLVWDGHKRIHNWMSDFLGTADDQYTRAVGLKTLVACIKRVYEPGCKFDYITVLEGDQGSGKSTAWRILAGKKWFGDTPIDISKEWSIMKTFGKLMYEWAEMESFRRANTQAMRAFLSSDTDTVRLPYNRTVQPIPRQGIFVGTFNPEKDKDIGWLHDTTGNRRYWIVATGVHGDIRNDKLEQARDQIWAEAFLMYKNDIAIHFEDSAVILQAQEEQAKRLGRDPWHYAIETWVNSSHNLVKNIFMGEEIFRDCIGGSLTQYKRIEMTRISRVMSEIGWSKGTFYDKRAMDSIRGYKRPVIE